MKSGAQTKQRLVDQATQLVQQRGFAATSVSQLLLAAGIKKGTLYHYFSGKDELGLAVLAHAKRRFLARLDEVLKAPTPRQQLQRFFAFVLETHRSAGFVGGCLFGNTALEMSDCNARYAELVDGVFTEWSDKLAAVLRRGQAQGQFRSDLRAEQLSQTIVATVEGGIMLARVRKDERSLRDCLQALEIFLSTDSA